MANRDNPQGFVPVRMLTGHPVPTMDFAVDADEATNLFVGDLITAEADGKCNPAAANDGGAVLGAVVAIYDSNGIPAGHPSSAISTKYKPASTAAIVTVALGLPGALFRCQSDSGTNVAETERFATANHVAGAGDTTTAVSKHELDADDIGTGLQLRIVDKVDEPGNDWGDEHVDLLVMFNESVFNSPAATAAATI